MKKYYHFIGIGGIGMGTLASLLLSKGCKVSGSDIRQNAMMERLQKEGARIFYGHDASYINDADCVVFSSAISKNNPEISAAKKKQIAVIPRARLLVDLMKGYDGITVAGAHGKTTTSSMIARLLIKADFKPTVAVGGSTEGSTNNALLGSGNYFVAELDESDGSFLYFKPKYSVITNIDFEHVDYYQNWDNILNAYRKFMNQTEEEGKLFVCGDDFRLSCLMKESTKNFVTYGFSEENDCVARNIVIKGFETRFECIFQGKHLGSIHLNVPGRHNILNALACISVGIDLSIDFNIIQKSLEEYRSVRRRFQVKGKVNGAQIIDDYAHHPTEIKAVLETAQQLLKGDSALFSDRKNKKIGRCPLLITVFQPHRYSRLQALFKEFVVGFSQSDYVIVTDIYAASEEPIEGVTSQKLVKAIEEVTDSPVVYVEREHVEAYLVDIVEPEDLVLTLGAGDITDVLKGDSALFYEENGFKKGRCIGVLMGGYSSERAISLKSGRAVYEVLKASGCDVVAIDITERDENKILAQILKADIELAFIALHGQLGEDGTIQTILEKSGIPYTGSGVEASRLAINKIDTKILLKNNGIAVPRFVKGDSNLFYKKNGFKKVCCPLLPLPCVVKPIYEGSSIGISLVRKTEEWEAAIKTARQYGTEVLCEEYIKGRELTVGILGKIPLPVIEICPEKEFFDFTAKYNKGMTDYIVPAKILDKTASVLQEIALSVHNIVGCKDFSRVDFILSEEGIPYVLEINTIPGFTETSLLPMAAQHTGMDFQQLCRQLVMMNIGTGLTPVPT